MAISHPMLLQGVLKRRSITTCVLSLLCLFCYAAPAHAFSCTMAATNIAFGSIDVTTGSAVSNTGTFTVTCSGSPSNQLMRMCVSINGGSSSDSTSRLMNGPGASKLRFQLYSDSSHTTPWGSWPLNLYGGGNTWDVLGTTSTSTGNKTFYGQVLGSQQAVTAGSYTSTLTLFFTYDSNNNVACPENGKGNSTTTFTATATVTPTCTISASTLNLGTWSGAAAQAGVTKNSAAVGVTCTNGSPYAIGMSNGNNASGSQRRLAVGGNFINYGLYLDLSYSVPWTTASNSTTCATTSDCYLATGNGSLQSITVYAKTPALGTQPCAGNIFGHCYCDDHVLNGD